MKGSGVFVLLMLVSISYADVTVYSTDFNEKPEGWYNDRWTFSEAGAKASYFAGPGNWREFDMISFTGSTPVRYFVPDGADSVSIAVDHHVHGETSEGYAYARLYVETPTAGSTLVYEQVAYYYGTFTDDDPIVYTIVDPPNGTYLGFHFHAEAGADPSVGYGTINWELYHMEVTAYGSSMSMEVNTWAGIKSCLF
ncbi:MAG: hypothetical protein J7K88_07285 [Candidatus Fermentibacteraceae bacterium]|nr:hypothetical protein [Candidatus Fermentibacteraceae bacterium]